MADENELSALESEDVWKWDEQTAACLERIKASVNQYRSQTWPSDFLPPPDLPEDDDPPEADDPDTTTLESNQVGYYDQLITEHIQRAKDAAERFQEDLERYAEAYKRRTGEDYPIPKSEVQPIDISPDGEDALESNTVDAYDAASGDLLKIWENASGAFPGLTTDYEETLASAIEKFDALTGEADGGIQKRLQSVRAEYANAYTGTHSDPVMPEDMSIAEALGSHLANMTTLWNDIYNLTDGAFLTNIFDPAIQGIKDYLKDLSGMIAEGLIDISEIP